MIKTFLLVLVYILVSALEVIHLHKENKIKELILYISLLSLSLIANIMLLNNFDYISLAKLIDIVLGLD